MMVGRGVDIAAGGTESKNHSQT